MDAHLALLDQPRFFCYLYIKQKAEAIIALAILVVGLLLVAKAAHQYHQARKIDLLTKTAKLVYIIIFAWAIRTR